MPAKLVHPLAKEHGEEILRLESEMVGLFLADFEAARTEVIARLAELPAETFTAQQNRIVLVQIEQAIRTLLKRQHERYDRALDRLLRTSVDQITREIRYYERGFRQAQGRIQTRALRKLATPRGLLLHKFDVSMRTYGGELIGQIQRRLAVHMIRKSSIRDTALDVAGKLRDRGILDGRPRALTMRESRWRAERIVRTEVIDALDEARGAALEESKAVLPDLMQMWDAALESDRTCMLCRKLDGRIRELGQPFGYVKGRPIMAPPDPHPHCRCARVPFRQEWVDDEAAEA